MLIGGDGVDILLGGPGTNMISGGIENDIFLFDIDYSAVDVLLDTNAGDTFVFYGIEQDQDFLLKLELFYDFTDMNGNVVIIPSGNNSASNTINTGLSDSTNIDSFQGLLDFGIILEGVA